MAENEQGAGRPAALEVEGRLLVVHMRAPLDATEVERVCAHLRAVLVPERTPVACHVHGAPDLSVVGALGRLALLCRRLDVPLRIRSTGVELVRLEELLVLTGLGSALPARSEPVGDSEPREQRRVEEVVHMGDVAG